MPYIIEKHQLDRNGNWSDWYPVSRQYNREEVLKAFEDKLYELKKRNIMWFKTELMGNNNGTFEYRIFNLLKK